MNHFSNFSWNRTIKIIFLEETRYTLQQINNLVCSWKDMSASFGQVSRLTLLTYNHKSSIEDNCPISEGIVPCSMFLSNPRSSSLVKRPTSVGIVPFILFIFVSHMSYVRFIYIISNISLTPNSKSRSDESNPSSGGIVPDKSLSFRICIVFHVERVKIKNNVIKRLTFNIKLTLKNNSSKEEQRLNSVGIVPDKLF